jgi:tetratricopeptide (TPR) repeat protein
VTTRLARAPSLLPIMLVLIGKAIGCRSSDTASDHGAVVEQQVDGYAEAVAEIDRQIEQAQLLARERDDWADHELVASLFVQRARLTGMIEDWVRADETLDLAFARAPAGGGPVLARLELDLSLHRLDQAAQRLVQAEAAPVQTLSHEVAVAIGRGELAAQRGQLDVAQAAYEHAEKLRPDPANAGRLALLARRRGDAEAARAGFQAARAGVSTGRGAAWTLLQEGLVEWDRERAEAALERYDAAEQAFPGWWLVTEHRAEALAALGQTERAEQLYRTVIEDTGHPEFMDALGELLLARGEEAEARTWFAAARKEHERRLALLPEAAGAHALDHLIRHAPTEPRTLALAREVARIAPNEDNLRRLAEAEAGAKR